MRTWMKALAMTIIHSAVFGSDPENRPCILIDLPFMTISNTCWPQHDGKQDGSEAATHFWNTWRVFIDMPGLRPTADPFGDEAEDKLYNAQRAEAAILRERLTRELLDTFAGAEDLEVATWEHSKVGVGFRSHYRPNTLGATK